MSVIKRVSMLSQKPTHLYRKSCCKEASTLISGYLMNQLVSLILFRMEGGAGATPLPPPPPPPSSFFPVTSTNVRISLKNWLLVLTLLLHWCKISRPYLVQVPNYWAWTKTTSQKTWFFWSNSYKIEVMITYFSHRKARVTKLWSHDHIYDRIWVT